MPDYVKLPEVARRLDVSEKTARRMVKAGKLPAVFIGNAYRVSEEDLAKYLESAKVEPGKAPRRSPYEPSFNDVLAEERPPVLIEAAAGAAAGSAAALSIGEHFRAIVVDLRRAGRDEEADRVEKFAADLLGAA